MRVVLIVYLIVFRSMFPPTVCELLKRSTQTSMWSDALALAISEHSPNYIAEVVRLTATEPNSNSAKNLHTLLVHVAGTRCSSILFTDAQNAFCPLKPRRGVI